MIHEETNVVRDWNQRASAQFPERYGKCFYCSAPLGGEHKSDCVCRIRSVVIRATVEFVYEVPQNWDADSIEFNLNDGSRCCGNTVKWLSRLQDCMNDDNRPDIENHPNGCWCEKIEHEYVREATAEDEQYFALDRNPDRE